MRYHCAATYSAAERVAQRVSLATTTVDLSHRGATHCAAQRSAAQRSAAMRVAALRDV